MISPTLRILLSSLNSDPPHSICLEPSHPQTSARQQTPSSPVQSRHQSRRHSSSSDSSQLVHNTPQAQLFRPLSSSNTLVLTVTCPPSLAISTNPLQVRCGTTVSLAATNLVPVTYPITPKHNTAPSSLSSTIPPAITNMPLRHRLPLVTGPCLG